MLSRSYKYYWWCQIAGWGFVGLSLIFFAYTFEQDLDRRLSGPDGLVILAGIGTTHLLSWVISQFNWLLLPIEKVLPRLLIAVIFPACLQFAGDGVRGPF